jgi:peptidoglycan-N-acetylglucosamine deacetylase
MRSRKKRRLKKSIREAFGLLLAALILLSAIWMMDIGKAESSDGLGPFDEVQPKERTSAVQKETAESGKEQRDAEKTNERSEETVSIDERVQQEDVPDKSASVEQEQQESVNEPAGDDKPREEQKETGVRDEQQTVYLTFDDGPNENTEGILNVLDQYDAKATFFMLEPNMKKFRKSVEDMGEKGHSVGMHGVTHDAAAFYQSSQSVIGEMKKAQSTLESITGIHSNLIRVPYGSVPNMTPLYRQAVDDEGFKMWDWNIDSEDWRLLSEEYVPNIMEQINSFPYKGTPKIILMHEKDITLTYLDELLKHLTEEGFIMKAITEQMNPVSF